MPQIRGKLVHFPPKDECEIALGTMYVRCTGMRLGKVPRIRGNLVHFPETNNEKWRESVPEKFVEIRFTFPASSADK